MAIIHEFSVMIYRSSK